MRKITVFSFMLLLTLVMETQVLAADFRLINSTDISMQVDIYYRAPNPLKQYCTNHTPCADYREKIKSVGLSARDTKWMPIIAVYNGGFWVGDYSLPAVYFKYQSPDGSNAALCINPGQTYPSCGDAGGGSMLYFYQDGNIKGSRIKCNVQYENRH